jgi:hypothetical protein
MDRFEIFTNLLKTFQSMQVLVELKEIEQYNATPALKIFMLEGSLGGIFDQ